MMVCITGLKKGIWKYTIQKTTKLEVEAHHISDIKKYLIKQDEAEGNRGYGKEENAAHWNRGFRRDNYAGILLC